MGNTLTDCLDILSACNQILTQDELIHCEGICNELSEILRSRGIHGDWNHDLSFGFMSYMMMDYKRYYQGLGEDGDLNDERVMLLLIITELTPEELLEILNT